MICICDTIRAMAKKKQGKKHKFKYASPVMPGQSAPEVSSTPNSGGGKRAVAGLSRSYGYQASLGRDFSYVSVDLRRIGVLAVSLIALELVIWYLFGHTGLGNWVYQSVQV